MRKVARWTTSRPATLSISFSSGISTLNVATIQSSFKFPANDASELADLSYSLFNGDTYVIPASDRGSGASYIGTSQPPLELTEIDVTDIQLRWAAAGATIYDALVGTPDGLVPYYGISIYEPPPIAITRPEFGSGYTYCKENLSVDELIDLTDGNGNKIYNLVNYTDADLQDTYAGTANNDLILGPDRPGSIVDGLAGDDCIIGGPGNGNFDGGPGDDYIHGGAGDDGILGGPGNDYLLGQDGNDGLHGGPGNDHMMGGPGNDTLLGNEGDDTIYGGPGNDATNGGPGNDHIEGNEGSNSADGGSGDDVIYPRDAPNYVRQTGTDPTYCRENLTIDDLLVVNATTGNNIHGYTVIDGRNSSDAAKIAGTSGNDLILVHDGGTAGVYGYGGNDCIIGGAGDDYIVGDGSKITDGILDTPGNDYIYGNDGDDTIYGTDGDNWIYGGSGDDFIFSGFGVDTEFGGPGTDTINNKTEEGDGATGNSDSAGSPYNEPLTGQSSPQNSDGEPSPRQSPPPQINEEPTYCDGMTVQQLVDSGSYNMIDERDNNTVSDIRGTSGDDLILAPDHGVTIHGKKGNDCIIGGAGDDLIKGQQGDDILYGNGGVDDLRGNRGSDTVAGDADDSRIAGGKGVDTCPDLPGVRSCENLY